MDGIVSPLEATHEGNLHYEMMNDEGKVSVLEGTDIFMPDLKCRLLIPHDNFIEIQRLDNTEVSFTMTWEKSVLNFSEQVPITINYE